MTTTLVSRSQLHFLQMPGSCTSGKLLGLLLDWVLDSQLLHSAGGDGQGSALLMEGPPSPPALPERCAKVGLGDWQHLSYLMQGGHAQLLVMACCSHGWPLFSASRDSRALACVLLSHVDGPVSSCMVLI